MLPVLCSWEDVISFFFSHLSLAVILVFFGVLNFHSIVLECVGGEGRGGLGNGEEKQKHYKIYKTS